MGEGSTVTGPASERGITNVSFELRIRIRGIKDEGCDSRGTQNNLFCKLCGDSIY